MVARRIGAPTEIKTAALRAISSGHLHECPDGRVGVYLGALDKAIGEDIVLHTCERLEVAAADFAATLAGDVANFNFTTQTLVLNGGTNCGRYLEGKAVSATTAFILLNDQGETGGGSGGVLTKTADYTVGVADSGKVLDTTGASGAVVFALPPAVPGLRYRARVGAVQELRLDPNGTEVIGLPSTGVLGAAGAYITANAIGESVDLECVVAGQWTPFGSSGTWTAQP